MHCEFIGALEVTYGNALAAGGGFHRVTTPEGSAAELAPLTFLWYKLAANSSNNSSATPRGASLSSSSSAAPEDASTAAPRGITQLRVEAEDWTPPPPSLAARERRSSRAAVATWSRIEKPVDRQRGRFVWFESVDWHGPPSPSASPVSSSSSSSSTAAVVASGASEGSKFPLKEIRVVRDLKDVPEGFECLSEPIVSSPTSGSGSTWLCLCWSW